MSTSPGSRPRNAVALLMAIAVTVAVVLIAERTGHGRSIVSSVQRFRLFYMGVFALIALTAAVGVGLLATDRIVMRPANRVVAQAVHRGISLTALTALTAHIVLEVIAHRSHSIDAIVPFLARSRPLYVGLGTVASDLFVLIIVTGIMRGRFAARWPWAWRAIHTLAYLAWPLSVVHGLTAGRTAKPYVDWSYGACLAAVGLALAVRFVATLRHQEEKISHPVADRLSSPAEGVIPGTSVTPLTTARSRLAALPAGPARNGGLAGAGSSVGAGGGSSGSLLAQLGEPGGMSAASYPGQDAGLASSARMSAADSPEPASSPGGPAVGGWQRHDVPQAGWMAPQPDPGGQAAADWAAASAATPPNGWPVHPDQAAEAEWMSPPPAAAPGDWATPSEWIVPPDLSAADAALGGREDLQIPPEAPVSSDWLEAGEWHPPGGRGDQPYWPGIPGWPSSSGGAQR
jgi:hypothetical protein